MSHRVDKSEYYAGFTTSNKPGDPCLRDASLTCCLNKNWKYIFLRSSLHQHIFISTVTQSYLTPGMHKQAKSCLILRTMAQADSHVKKISRRGPWNMLNNVKHKLLFTYKLLYHSLTALYFSQTQSMLIIIACPYSVQPKHPQRKRHLTMLPNQPVCSCSFPF